MKPETIKLMQGVLKTMYEELQKMHEQYDKSLKDLLTELNNL